jgi:hypothetical protein
VTQPSRPDERRSPNPGPKAAARNRAALIAAGEIYAEHGPGAPHGFTCHGFPNLFQMGSLQNASSVNFTHVLDEQAVHSAALVAAAEAKGALVEPSRESEDAWVDVCAQDAPDPEWFHAECSPRLLQSRGPRPPQRPDRLPARRGRLPRPPAALARGVRERDLAGQDRLGTLAP